MAKLENGTKVKMKETVGVMLASLVTNNFEVGTVGEIIEEHNGYHEVTDATWYNVKFEKGTEILPEVWFEVIEEPKEECDCDKCEKCCDDVELPENHGDIITIQYNGDSLEITVTTEDGDMIEMEDPTDKEVDITFSLVNALYNVLGIGVKYPHD